MTALEPFRQITIGGLTKEFLLQRLIDAGIHLNKYAKVLFEHPAFSPGQQSEKVTLLRATLPDLRLSSPCSVHDIISRASALGLGYRAIGGCDWPQDNAFMFLKTGVAGGQAS